MTAMIVRCGKCRIELEIASPGEFLCPSCGTRNVVRGPAAGASPYGVPDLGGLSTPAPPPAPGEPAPGVSWVVCPACSWRFAVGEVERVSCPTCAAELTVSEGSVALAGS